MNRTDSDGDSWFAALVVVLVVVVVAAVVIAAKDYIDTQIELNTVTQAEEDLAKSDYIAAYNVNEAKKVADTYTKEIFGEEGLNNDGTVANAYRHAMWNAVMTDKIGVETAENFANAHEDYEYNNIEHMNMDLHNNELGRNIALQYAGQGYDVFSQKILEAIYNQEAVVISWDN